MCLTRALPIGGVDILVRLQSVSLAVIDGVSALSVHNIKEEVHQTWAGDDGSVVHQPCIDQGAIRENLVKGVLGARVDEQLTSEFVRKFEPDTSLLQGAKPFFCQ